MRCTGALCAHGAAARDARVPVHGDVGHSEGAGSLHHIHRLSGLSSCYAHTRFRAHTRAARARRCIGEARLMSRPCASMRTALCGHDGSGQEARVPEGVVLLRLRMPTLHLSDVGGSPPITPAQTHKRTPSLPHNSGRGSFLARATLKAAGRAACVQTAAAAAAAASRRIPPARWARGMRRSRSSRPSLRVRAWNSSPHETCRE